MKALSRLPNTKAETEMLCEASFVWCLVYTEERDMTFTFGSRRYRSCKSVVPPLNLRKDGLGIAELESGS